LRDGQTVEDGVPHVIVALVLGADRVDGLEDREMQDRQDTTGPWRPELFAVIGWRRGLWIILIRIGMIEGDCLQRDLVPYQQKSEFRRFIRGERLVRPT